MKDKKKIEPRKTFYINRERTISLFNLIWTCIVISLLVMIVTVVSVKDEYMYKYTVRSAGELYHIGITVPQNADSTYTRLYPNPLETGTGKPFIIITDQEKPDVTFTKGNKK